MKTCVQAEFFLPKMANCCTGSLGLARGGLPVIVTDLEEQQARRGRRVDREAGSVWGWWKQAKFLSRGVRKGGCRDVNLEWE
jgi:hypothetical protein